MDFRNEQQFDKALDGLRDIFARIPKRGPTQDESKFADPYDLAAMRLIQAGKQPRET